MTDEEINQKLDNIQLGLEKINEAIKIIQSLTNIIWSTTESIIIREPQNAKRK